MIEGLVEQIEQRHAELERLMGDQDVLGDRRRAAEVGREYRQMGAAAKLAAEWRHAKSDEDGFKELLALLAGRHPDRLDRVDPERLDDGAPLGHGA